MELRIRILSLVRHTDERSDRDLGQDARDDE
jgi:hypothetical protein